MAEVVSFFLFYMLGDLIFRVFPWLSFLRNYSGIFAQLLLFSKKI